MLKFLCCLLLVLLVCDGAGSQGCRAPPGVAQVECAEGAGIEDCRSCAFATIPEPNATCAPFLGGAIADPQGDAKFIVLGSLLACAMAFAIGGNNAGDSWGAAVGSGAIRLQAACLLCGTGEVLGAALLGAGVCSTLQEGVAPLQGPANDLCWACGLCDSKMGAYQLGMFAALCGAVLFLLGATRLGMPVSSTHVVVGGAVGMTWASVGLGCLTFSSSEGLGAIAISWVASPIAAGVMGSAMYILTHLVIFKSRDPVKVACFVVPCLYGITSALMLYLTLLMSPMTRTSFKPMPRLLVSIATLLVVPIVVSHVVMPSVETEIAIARRYFEMNSQSAKVGTLDIDAAIAAGTDALGALGDGQARPVRVYPDAAERQGRDCAGVAQKEAGLKLFAVSTPTLEQALAKHCFKHLLVFNAFLESFAVGANDTANATGPFSSLYNTYAKGIHACEPDATPWWIVLVAGLFVFLGVNTMGHRVIATTGKCICSLDFHIGYCVEFASASAVVAATLAHMPVSTTYCQIGAVVCVGAVAAGTNGVSWWTFGKIALTWLATLPSAGIISALQVKLYS